MALQNLYSCASAKRAGYCQLIDPETQNPVKTRSRLGAGIIRKELNVHRLGETVLGTLGERKPRFALPPRFNNHYVQMDAESPRNCIKDVFLLGRTRVGNDIFSVDTTLIVLITSYISDQR